jgi:hypothetical protein
MMKNVASLSRGTVAASLVVCAVTTVVGVLLMPDFSGSQTQWLQAIAAEPTTAATSALLYVGSQLPFAVGLVGVAHLVRGRAPVLAALGAGFAVLGAFGHAVYGGVNLVMLQMAADPGNLAIHAKVLDGVGSGAAVPFMALGLLGTVLGLVLLGVAIWRAALGPRWLGPVLVLFVLVEFAGSGISVWAGYASAALFLVGFLALAKVVATSERTHWTTASEAAQREPVTV